MEAPADFVAFCDREHPRLVGALHLFTGNRAVAEEIAQEALVRAADRWPRVRQLESPGGWTHRVAMNLARSSWRRRQAERRAVTRRGPDPVVHVDQDSSTVLAVREAVRQLPERQRAAVVLRHFLDLSVPEAAERLGVSDVALRSLTKRGLEQLRVSLGPDVALEASDVT